MRSTDTTKTSSSSSNKRARMGTGTGTGMGGEATQADTEAEVEKAGIGVGVGVGGMGVWEVVQNPLPGYSIPGSVAFSPDDTLISYLQSGEGSSLHRRLLGVWPQTGERRVLADAPVGVGVDEANLSSADALRRERLRERGLGITRYEWATNANANANANSRCSNRSRSSSSSSSSTETESETDTDCNCTYSSSSSSPFLRLMLPLPRGIYVQDVLGSDLSLRLESLPSSPILDPQLSPDGSMIAFVREDEMFVVPVTGGEPKQITFGARGNGKSHGLAEYIAQEEMERRNGFWWSPDSKHIAFTEVDASEVPIYRIMHQGKATVGKDAQEDHAYPFAGQANVKVLLGVVPAAGGDVCWMDLSCGPSETHVDEEYLVRVTWMNDSFLFVQVLNREHTQLKLLKFDTRTGVREILLIEENEVWVNLHDCFTPLHKGVGSLAGGFIWASEKSGFRHLYLHSANGLRLGPITQGNWMVEHIAGVDENSGIVYFVGTLDSPLESHLYRTDLFPDFNLPLNTPKRLTQGEGRHSVVLDHQMRRFVDIHDSLKTLPRVLLCSLENGRLLMTLYEQASTPRTHMLHLSAPEIVQITASDGTPLYGALYKPAVDLYGPPPYRTVVSVYGGPNVQTVFNSWMNTVDMRAQYLCSKGILVWKLDNRGTARRGLKFESVLKNNIGNVDVEDQRTGVEWLIKQGWARKDEVGIYGWSYGGYLAAMTLAQCPDIFCCAVSGAPVTAWDGYDTFYTEKYMGFPMSNHAAYDQSSVMHHVSKIKGKLLLIHGMIDENVHFRHTARLVNAFVAAGKDYELLIFPDERHMPRRLRDRIYMEERICAFFEKNL